MGKEVRKLSIKLSEEDWEAVEHNAKSFDGEISELIQAFLKDLVYSDESNGSDERELANKWFYRCKVNYE